MMSINHLFEIEQITFPEEEHQDISKRLKSGKDVTTVRVGKELGKYKQGQTYITPWKTGVVVKSIRRIRNIKEYQHYDELTKEQKIFLSRHNKLDVVTLQSIKISNI